MECRAREGENKGKVGLIEDGNIKNNEPMMEGLQK